MVHPIEQIHSTVSQFQVVKGSGDPSYTGDLNVHIPLLTVPGRNGLNYDIDLDWISGNGVSAQESASWVGLGWNLSQYQITCNPNYIIKSSVTNSADVKYDNHVCNLSKDVYNLSYPGGSTQIRQFSHDNNKWYPLKWSAIKIETEEVNNESISIQYENQSPVLRSIYKDFKRFIVTGVDGTKYIYSQRLKKLSEKTLVNHCNCDPGPDNEDTHGYYYVFKLTAILGPDYVDGGGDKYTPDDAGTPDKGNWIKLIYSIPKVKMTDNNYGLLMEINYLSEIQTPTHKAVFNLTSNEDNLMTFGGKNISFQTEQSLSNIQLFSKNENKLIKTVNFEKSKGLNWVETIAGQFQIVNDTSIYRLRLDKVTIKGADSSAIPSYKFTYNANPIQLSTDHLQLCGPDPWGLFTRDNSIAFPTESDVTWDAWMLNSITYPTGTKEDFCFESDRYQTPIYSSRYANPIGAKIISGGLRLKSRKITEPLTNKVSEYKYEYALTNKLYPGYGYISCEPFFSANEAGLGTLESNDVVQDYDSEVHYPDIKITLPDSSVIKKYFTSSFSNATIDTIKSIPFRYDYSNFNDYQTTIIHEPDPYLDAPNTEITWSLGALYTLWDFYDMTGKKLLQSQETGSYGNQIRIYRTEAREFDDEPLVYDEYRPFKTFKLVNNSWKRGLITKEEHYSFDPDRVDPASEKPQYETKVYYYDLKPIMSDACRIRIVNDGAASNYYEFYSIITSGWAQLTKVITYKDRGTLYFTDKYEYSPDNGLIKKEIKENASGIKSKITYYSYAYKSASNAAMAAKHMLSQKELTVIGNGSSTFSDTLNKNLNIADLTRETWSNSLSGDTSQWYKDNVYKWNDKIDNDRNYDTGEETCIQDNISYDQFGNVLESKDANGTMFSTKWGYNSTLPIAGSLNSSLKETKFLDFEDASFGDWTSNTTNYSFANISHTGSKGLLLGPTIYDYIWRRLQSTEINCKNKYILSGWINTTGTHPMLSGYVKFTDGSSTTPQTIKASGTGAWQYLELTFDLPTIIINNQNKVISFLEISFKNGDNITNDACTWDDIRFYPEGAQLITNTYDQTTFNLTSNSDANSIPTYYLYDGLQRLIRECDFSGRKLTENSYFYSCQSNIGETFNPIYPNSISTLKYIDASSSLSLTTYFDGSGRKAQTQTRLGSQDIVANYTYDLMDRPYQNYKSYQYNTNHLYDPNALVHATSYYNDSVYCGSNGKFTDSYPYRTTEYYFNGKVKYDKPEGNDWQNDHFIEYNYGTNYLSELVEQKTTYNENNSHNNYSPTKEMKYEYYDILGNLVQTVDDPQGLNITTKYFYDILGRLTKSTPSTGDVYSTTYTYNTLGLLIKETSPDAGTVQYIYDANGNIRFIKDANHTSTSVNNVNYSGSIIGDGAPLINSFTLQNKGNVKIALNANMEEIYTGTATVQLKSSNGAVLYSITASSSNPTPSSSFVLPKGTYSYYIVSTAESDYPLLFSIQCTKNLEFIYNKYDKLNRIIETGEYETSLPGDYSQTNADSANFPMSNTILAKKYCYDVPTSYSSASGQRNLKGRLSFSTSYSSGYETNVSYYSYDEMGRVEWNLQVDLGWYQKKLVYTYDLQGNVKNKSFIDYDWRSGNYYTFYTYDQAGRLSTVKTGPNNDINNGSTQEAAYSYFASGKTKRLQLANAQGVDYRYNERDWLTMINHHYLDGKDINGIPLDPGRDGNGSGLPADRFGMVIDYNKIGEIGTAQNATAQWNGNISSTMYQMAGVPYQGPAGSSSIVGYTYSYDKANRLKKSNFGYYYANAWRPTYAFDENINRYDSTGNIILLTRYGKNAGITQNLRMDSLVYNYYAGTNRLNYISDKISSSSDSCDLDNQSMNNYLYDANGNVICDIGSGISFIINDINNLPSRVYLTSGIQLFYGYDVNGNRVRNLVIGGTDNFYVNSPAGKTEVVDLAPYGYNYIYNIWGNDNLGQIKINEGTYSRYYYLKDHLGSIRMTVNSAGNPDSWNDYYSFGGVMDGRSRINLADKRYKFTGKERDDETGLDYFGARYYDSKIGRWLSVDPLADKYLHLSPYNYVENNPIRKIDHDGREIGDYFTKLGAYLASDDKKDGKVYIRDNGHDQEIPMASNLGYMIRAVYAEMRGGDDNSKSIVAESIRNRAELPQVNSRERVDGTYKGVIKKDYNVAKSKVSSFAKPVNSIYRNNAERNAWIKSVSASLKAHYGRSNIGKGVIFYNSDSSTSLDKTETKIILDIEHNGIKGLWKLKK